MKFSTLVSVTLFTVAQFNQAIPVPEPTWANDTIADAPFSNDYVTVRGAGQLHHEYLQKRNTDGRVTGVRVGYSGNYRVYRQEIRKFYTDQGGRVHDLFVLSLNRLMTRGANDMNGWWQLAGIHGRPFQAWNGRNSFVVGGSAGAPYSNAGYCTHGSTLFPTWHRPYLAYVEELIWANAQQLVNAVTNSNDRANWQAALMVLRLPYWDWATYNAELPSFALNPTHNLRYSYNGVRSVPNPLYSGKFLSGTYNGNGNFYPPFSNWQQTLRFPTSQDSSAQSRMNDVQAGLRSIGPSIRSRVLSLLLDNKTWAGFSNRASKSGAPDSIESIHDAIHGYVGRDGHMSQVPFSSFDPIFFLHHCNIDRLFAIWQAIYPTVYVTSQVNGGGTYGRVPGSTDYRTSKLEPWLSPLGGVYTSDGVRDTSTFGYGYFETPKWKYTKATERAYSDATKKLVQQLYGGAFVAKRKRDVNNPLDAGIDASIINGNQHYEWRIDCIADKSALNGTYYVHFFLGKPSKNPADWYTQPELVGSYVVFAHTTQAAPGIDPAEIDNTVTGAVPLTDSMVKAFGESQLRSSKPVDAIPFLEKRLRWRVTSSDGTPVRVKDVQGLKVAVSVALVTEPTEDTPWNVYGSWTHVADIVKRIGHDGGPDKVGIVPSPSVTSTPISSTAQEAPASTTDLPAVVTEAPTSSEEAAINTDSTTSVEPTSVSTTEAPAPTSDD